MNTECLLCIFVCLFAKLIAEKSYYDVMGISRNASEDEVKKAYRNLARKLHPDKNPNRTKEAEIEFKELGEAYATLSDLVMRLHYDEELLLQAQNTATKQNKQPPHSPMAKAKQYNDDSRPQFLHYVPNNGGLTGFKIDFDKLGTDVEGIPMTDFFVLVHGYGKEHPKPWEAEMVGELQKKGFTVLQVLWNKASAEPDYKGAAENSRTVGEMLAKLLRSLALAGKIATARTTCIGHGLGAHVCGFAGKQLRKLGGSENQQQLYRIFGLDPQNHLFNSAPSSDRLDRSDAAFVWVLHTDSRKKKMGMAYGEGMSNEIGTADFFGNGGQDQPGCPQTAHTTAYLTSKRYEPSCDHQKAAEIMLEAVKNYRTPGACRFTTFNCLDFESADCYCGSDCPVFGLELDRLVEGKYSFYTRQLTNVTHEALCGRPYQVVLKADKKVTGNVVLGIGFQEAATEFIRGHVNSSFSYVSDWNAKPRSVSVKYDKGRHQIRGTKPWNLEKLSLRSLADNVTYLAETSTSAIHADSNNQLMLNLQRENSPTMGQLVPYGNSPGYAYRKR